MPKQKSQYKTFVREKVEAGREFMRLKQGKRNEGLEARFAEKRMLLIESAAFDALDRDIENNPAQDNKQLLELMERPNRWF